MSTNKIDSKYAEANYDLATQWDNIQQNKEQTTNIHNNLDESPMHCANQNEPTQKSTNYMILSCDMPGQKELS